MVQCEMCGTETASPNTVKIEGAELDVCDECTEFGTEVKQQSSSGSSTKYSTGSGSSSGSSSSSSSSGGSSRSSGGSQRRSDMFDEMDQLAQDYDDVVRSARESQGLSQKELAQKLNEKSSLIRKIERGDTLPSDEVQSKLERALDVDLSAGASPEDTEWESENAGGGYTLGDVVERKD